MVAIFLKKSPPSLGGEGGECETNSEGCCRVFTLSLCCQRDCLTLNFQVMNKNKCVSLTIE